MSENIFKPKQKEKKSSKFNETIFSDRKFHVTMGFGVLLSSLFLLFSFISYLSNGQADQSVVNAFLETSIQESGKEVANVFGLLGAISAHYFIFNWFGIVAFLIPLFFINVSANILGYRQLIKIPSFFIFSLFYLIWTPLLLGYIVLTMTNPGILSFLCGGIGYELALVINSFMGWGTILLILFSFAVFNMYFFDISNLSSLERFNLWMSKPLYFFKKNESTEANENILENEDLNAVLAKVKEEVELEDELDTTDWTIKQNESYEKFDPKEIKDLVLEENELLDQLPNTEIELTLPELEDDLELEVAEIPTEEKFAALTENYDPTLDLPKYKYPMIGLLTEYPTKDVKVTKEELESNKTKIVNTLINFKIGISSIKATIGPTVTLYEIVPEAGVKISKIKNLEDDIALSLAALGIRIIAPIPGKGTIGIEVPNKNREMVSARSVISTEKFMKSDFELPIVLGKTISNEVYITDLTKMPHLLMAGATGQGKSVGLNIILASLIYKKHPSQLKLVLVDPKKVELTLFNKLERHFLAKLPDTEEAIITDTTKVVHTLNSLCIEMDTRYDLLKDAGCRNLKEYNKKFINRRLNPKKGHRYLPYIVLVIDELADLIMTAGKEVEMPIARLAQLARAIGIHLIVATQRPSVNVITGIIKANFPARLSFRVTSKIDSRTILDAGGAEQLVGMGDMLLSMGSEMIRLQCAFLDTPEVDNICDFISEQNGYSSAYMLPEYVGEENTRLANLDLSERDAMFDDAARLIISHQQGSTSLIQRKMKLGYNRAGRIIDQLEAAGIVGPFEGSKARDVLISDEYSLEQKLADLNKQSNSLLK